jgi:putative nucleotidyltransferase with HDIG domain
MNWPARVYVVGMCTAGCVVLCASVSFLWTPLPPREWWLLAALTLVSGWAVLKMPAIPASFSISDVFTLTAVVAFGPSAGTLAVALDSLAISARLLRTGLSIERVLFNAAAPPVAMWASAHMFFRLSGLAPLTEHPLALQLVTPWLLMFAGVYFVLNTFSIAAAIALNDRVPVLAIWRAHFQSLWFTFIGGALGAAFVVFALQLGTYGLALLSLPLLLAGLLHFAYRNATGRVADQLRHLAEVNRLHLSTIEALAHAIDAKDAVTHGHIRRVQRWAVALAHRAGISDDRELRAIEAAALLHDIGKLAIPEHILNKPGKLSAAEFERMKTHARVGAEILSEIEFPYPVVPIVRHHHENWDGSGYPDGIAGVEIPTGARILSVVDCYDALTSDRPYRRALSSDEAFAIIQARAGSMYDPALVSAFAEIVSTSEGANSNSDAAAHGEGAAPSGFTNSSVNAIERPALEVPLGVRLGMALSSAMNLLDPQTALAHALIQLPDVDAAVVFQAVEGSDCLSAVAAAGTESGALRLLSIPVGERLSGWVAAVAQPMLNADAALDLFDTGVQRFRSAAAVPCTTAVGRPTVVTLYSSAPGPFSDIHVRLVVAAVEHGEIRAVTEAAPLRASA